MINTYRIELKWALLISLAGLLWLAMTNLLGFHSSKLSFYPVMYLIENIFIFVISLIFTLVGATEKLANFRLKNNFSNGMRTCLRIGLISVIAGALIWVIYLTYINPGFTTEVAAYNKTNYPESYQPASFRIPTFIRQYVSNRLFQSMIIAIAVPLILQRMQKKHEEETVDIAKEDSESQ